MTTRLLFDQYDIFYDYWDMASYAEKGKFYTDRWSVINHRDLQVGDQVYFINASMINEPGSNPRPNLDAEAGFFARGTVVDADEDEQKCLEDEEFEDLSPAYCSYEAEDEIDANEDEEVLFIRFDLDSVVKHPENVLKITELNDHADFRGLDMDINNSGDEFPAEYAAKLDKHWQAHIKKLAEQKLVVLVDN
jgi:hypothetical protein